MAAIRKPILPTHPEMSEISKRSDSSSISPLAPVLSQWRWRHCGTCRSGGRLGGRGSSTAVATAAATISMKPKKFTHRDGHLDGTFSLQHIGSAAN